MAALAAAGVRPAAGSRLGMFFDTDASTVERTQEAPATGTAWLLAVLGGDAAAAGISGAEFRLDNFPSGWFATPVPNPASIIVLGSPVTGGVNIAFPTCQPPTASGVVLLFTLNYFAVTSVDRYVMRIEAHSMPNNPNFNCPLVVLCDDPFFTKLCVAGGRAAFNFPGFDVPAVEQASWSVLKALYE